MERVTNTENAKNAIKAIEAGKVDYKKLRHKPLGSKEPCKSIETNSLKQKDVVRDCNCRRAYKEVLDIIKSTGEVECVKVHEVYEEDRFECSYGLNESLAHVPSYEDSLDKITYFYGCYKLKEGERGFVVISKDSMDKALEINAKNHDKLGYRICGNHYILSSFKIVLLKLINYMPIDIEEDKLMRL